MPSWHAEPTRQDRGREHLACTVDAGSCACHGSGAWLQVAGTTGHSCWPRWQRRKGHRPSAAGAQRDTDLMIGALQMLGVSVEGADTELRISGAIAPQPGARIDCGLAGTVLRLSRRSPR